jgi:hypothetical protein
MERVTFLVERTGERIPCLLNPEWLEVRRAAGISRRKGVGGAVIGNPRTDDPLVATGGGTTDYELKLLFDVDLIVQAPAFPFTASATPATLSPEGPLGLSTSLAEDAPEGAAAILPPPPPPASIDVRTLTQPLWALAENGDPVGGSIAPQRVRFIWGRSWNVPGVVLAAAERLERFDPEGIPQRSWLNLLLRRVEEEADPGSSPAPPTSPQFEINPANGPTDESGDDGVVVAVDDEGLALMPLHMIAAERYGDPRYDRAIAEYNDLDDLLELDEGRTLRLPPVTLAAEA